MALAAAGACTAFVAACSTGEPARPARVSPRVETRDFGSGARLRARAWDVDGALLLRDFFDVERDEPCAFLEDGLARIGPGRAYYCLPLGMAVHDAGSGPFADRRCTVPVALASFAGPSAYALVRPVDACASAPEVRRAGAARATFPWVLAGNRCVRSPTELVVQELGDVVPLESFVRAEEHVEDRGSRIGALVVRSPDGAWQTVGGFDRQRGFAVRAESPSGAPARWVPSRVAFQGAGEVLFADDACTSPVPTKIARDALCPLEAALVFTDPCGGTSWFELGPPVDASTLFAPSDLGFCSRGARPGVFAFTLGAPIAPESLAPVSFSEVGGDVVRRRGFAGVGGSVVTWGDVIDARTREPCAPATAIDGVVRCLPTASATIDLFADASCIDPAFAEPISPCGEVPSRRFVRADEPDGARVFEVTGEATALHRLDGDACTRVTPIVPSRGYAVREVDVAGFVPALERELPP